MRRKLGRKLNEGITADIFYWENSNKIIKLAKSKAYHQAMLTEYDNSQIAWDNGLPIPRPYELIDVDGRLGIVFERINGETLRDLISQAAYFSETQENLEDKYKHIAQISAKIFSETHSIPNKNMPSQRSAIIKSIYQSNFLAKPEEVLIVDIINNIPIKQQLCHGDPNLNNILIRHRDNKAFLIDWMYASTGNPEADAAEYIIMMRYSMLDRNIPRGFEDTHCIRERIIKAFIEEYTKRSDTTYDDIDSWIIPMAARRLSAEIISKTEKQLLVNEIRKRLEKYK